MQTIEPTNGWFQRHVVESLERLEANVDRLQTDVGKLQVSNAVVEERLRLRSSLYGALGGLLPAVAALIYFVFRG